MNNNRHLLSPTSNSNQMHRKFPSGSIMMLPPATGFPMPPLFSRQHSSSMDCTSRETKDLSRESPLFQPSTPNEIMYPTNRSPMQSPLVSPRTLAQPSLDRWGSGVQDKSSNVTPRSNTPNHLPSRDELNLQNFRLALFKCNVPEEQIQTILRTYMTI